VKAVPVSRVGRSIAVLATGLLVGLRPVDVRAQPPKRWNVSIGGGFVVPDSEVRAQVGSGWGLQLGVQFNVTPVFGIEGFLATNILGDNDVRLGVSPVPFAPSVPATFSVGMGMELAAGNVVVQSPKGRLRPYGLAGAGIYNRPITVTTPVTATNSGWVQGFCDPNLFVCSAGGFTPVKDVTGDRSSQDFGMDLGGGVNIGPSFFVEVRFHRIWGPTIEATPVVPDPGAPIPVAQKADGRFLVTSLGIRF
jgi:hypothetical protein